MRFPQKVQLSKSSIVRVLREVRAQITARELVQESSARGWRHTRAPDLGADLDLVPNLSTQIVEAVG